MSSTRGAADAPMTTQYVSWLFRKLTVLAAPANTVNLRNNQDTYWVVIGASAAPRVDDIRHAYLHFLLDGVVLRNMPKIAGTEQLLALAKSAEGVDPAYTSDLPLRLIWPM